MKGVSGKVISIVITLIIALIALAILFGMMNKMKPVIISFLDRMVEGIKEKICESMGPVAKHIICH